MSEKHIRAALESVARRRTASHVDLWTRIEAQVGRGKAPTYRQMRLAGRALTFAAAIFVCLFVFGTAVYAVQYLIELFPGFDPGLNQAHFDRIGLDLETTDALGDVAATLHWVYADAHRIAIIYSIAADKSPYVPVEAEVTSQLRLSDGTILPVIYAGGGGGGGGGGGESSHEGTDAEADGGHQTATPVLETGWALSGAANFDASTLPSNLEDVEVQLELRVHLMVESLAERASVPGTQPRPVSLGPFTFSFLVPYLPALDIELQQRESVGGVAISLQQASVTPSSTKVKLCVSGVAPHRTWLPEAHLDFGEQTIPDIGFIGIAPHISREGGDQCVVIDFLAPYRGEVGEWTLTIEQLVSPDPTSDALLVLKGPWRFDIPVH